MKLFLDEAGNTHEAVYFDGYEIADRLLEGVMIKIQVADDDTVSAGFLKIDSEYVSSLNESKLLKQAVAYVEDMIENEEFSALSPAPSQDNEYELIVELVPGPAPAPSRPTP